ncbi:tetratricopeptide repeat protein [Aurantibacillus circumpalustris]|uniref:tetratricopeptide repeat protein n=1 Tax=Aurantibacillus circumpalustris TaxID=3036359 RepID=UPI00295C20CB|nr:tetratricopeptide repeat protein [Aurantibacillus circumpalustris]
MNKKSLADTDIVNCSTKLSNLLLKNRSLEEAKMYAENAKALASKIQFAKGILNATNALAGYYSETGNYPEAIALYKEYISECKRLRIGKGLMFGHSNLGLTYRLAGNYKESLTCFFKALEIAEKNKVLNQMHIASYLNNISLVYANYSNYEKAIEYIERAITIANGINGQEEDIIIRSINLSTYYREFQQPKKAIKLLIEKISLNNKTINNEIYEAYMRNNLGQSYSDVGQESDAIREYTKAREIFARVEEFKFANQITINMALSYSRIGNNVLAIATLKEGLTGLEKVNDDELHRYATNVASMVYEKAGDYKKALLFANKSSVLKDSLLSQQQAEAIIDMRTKYETKQKEDSILVQKTEIVNQIALKEEVEKNLGQKTLLLLISIIALVAVSIFASMALVNYRKKRRANELLFEQKKTIELKNSENELLLGEIHHRVKNNLQVISSLLSLQERDVSDAGVKSAILEGKERVKSMELVHKMLYRENKFSGIEMQDYVNNLSIGLIESFGLSKSDVNVNIGFSPITLDVDTAVPLGLILNELIVNSLKHAKTATEKLNLKIEIFQSGQEQLIVNISDNGKGTVSDIETSDSFGLKIVRALIRQLKGVMEIKEQDGLHYFIELKNYKLIT